MGISFHGLEGVERHRVEGRVVVRSVRCDRKRAVLEEGRFTLLKTISHQGRRVAVTNHAKK